MAERKRVLSLTVSVGGGQRATVRFAGAELQSQHVAKLIEYLAVIEKALSIPSAAPQQEPPT